ncbi:MAG: AraC family transcriptional regulator [Marivita sp.]|uniref:helix-turn-helix transcriptional regulator n=1 Tax=Marivita sp. TaxID=2003365 RepID=UPI0025C3FC7F|nr:AraC family transcriptional regulator [Marivita sp.]MCI5109767.1 AraC family transcriptional regulator [Marivita sp.]
MSNTTIWFHTPGPVEDVFPYQVVAGGEGVAERGEPPVSRRFHQHVLILTVEGTGLVRQAQRRRRADPGAMVWLDTKRGYAHGCHVSSEFWRYLWIGVQGFGLDRLFEQAVAGTNPVTGLSDPAAAARRLETVHWAMRDRDPHLAAANSAAVGALLAQILADRRRPLIEAEPDSRLPLERVMRQLRRAIRRPWRIADMAEIAALSPSQLHRVFRDETGLSPMVWLRRERINAAKPLLLDRSLTVRKVAESVGYPDPFHFSRDFKKLTGRAPIEFRAAGGA